MAQYIIINGDASPDEYRRIARVNQMGGTGTTPKYALAAMKLSLAGIAASLFLPRAFVLPALAISGMIFAVTRLYLVHMTRIEGQFELTYDPALIKLDKAWLEKAARVQHGAWRHAENQLRFATLRRLIWMPSAVATPVMIEAYWRAGLVPLMKLPKARVQDGET